MKRSWVVDAYRAAGQVVRLQGWVETVRSMKKMLFVVLRDKTGTIQITHVRGGEGDQVEASLGSLTTGSAIEIVGNVVANEKVKLGQVEVIPSEVVVHSLADPKLPIAEDSGTDLRLDWRFIDLRRPRNRLIFEVQTTAEVAMRRFWQENGFLEIHSPKLMGGASESGSELFKVEYFGGSAYLAQSPQFYKQMAMAAGMERIFEVGPVFRADPSFTSRHATEFTSIDMEVSWIDSHEDVMSFEERWLHCILQAVRDEHGPAIMEHFQTDIVVPSLPFPRVTMEEALEIVRESGHVPPPGSKEGDLDPEGERAVCRHIKKTQGHEFAFVTEYPWSVRPFYHMKLEGKPHLTKSFDLLWKGLEVTTGAQREHRYDLLRQQAVEKGLSEASVQYYLDFFKYGCPPHGGLGFGLVRMLMCLLNIGNLREVTYLHRGPNRLTP